MAPPGGDGSSGNGTTAAAPLVSVVVIAYNQERFALRAMESVLRQTHTNLECIFVDDGSSDGTYERASQRAISDRRLKVFRKDNRGPSAARNFGAERVDRDSAFIAFLDGDDELLPTFIAETLTYLGENSRVGAVVPGYAFMDASGAALMRPRHRRWAPGWLGLFPRQLRRDEPDTPFVTFYCGTGGKPFWLARREIYDRTAGWNEGLWPFEDDEILAQFALITSVHFLDRTLVRYRIHSGQITHHGEKKSRWHVEGGLEIMQRQFNARQYGDPVVDRVVDDACRYYRQVHLPLRHARVATKSLVEGLRQLSMRKVLRACELYGQFIRDLVMYRVLFWRARRTYSI